MEKSENTTTGSKSLLRRLLRFVLWVIGIWAAILVLLQIVLSSSVLTGIVNRIGSEYVDGTLSFGKASVNMFRRFPNISLTLDDVSLTYPAGRFDSLETRGAQGALLYQGTGEESDTLAAFKRFSVSLNLGALLTGSINIPHMRLTAPRIYAHSYDAGAVNWDMFRFAASEEEEDTTGLRRLPKIVLGRISLAGRPHVVYTDSRDTVFAMIDIGKAAFNGRLNNRHSSRNRIGLSLDSIFVAGRVASDTLAFRLDRLHVHEHDDHADIDAAADAMLLTRQFGRLSIPMTIKGTAATHRDSIPEFHIEGMKISVAGIPVSMDAHLTLDKGRTGVEGYVEVTDFKLNDLIRDYASRLIPDLEKVSTDASLTLLAACQGDYVHSTGKLPSFSAILSIPEAEIRHSDIALGLNFGLEAEAFNDEQDRISIDVSRAVARTTGLNFSTRANAGDILGRDPLLSIDGTLSASLDTLASFLPDTLDIAADGLLTARLQGSARMSQLDLYNFSFADVSGVVEGDSIHIAARRDSLDAAINGLNIRIAPETVTSRMDTTQSHRLIGLTAEIADADISYKETMQLKGRVLKFSAKNTVDPSSAKDSTRVNRLGGRLSARSLVLKDAASMTLLVNETDNGFQMLPKPGSTDIPLLTVRSSSKGIGLRSSTNRIMLGDTKINASAAMNSIARRRQREARLDSLAKIYPDTPRDSLLRKARAAGGKNRRQPEEEEEYDFKDRDIDIRLDETMARYFREWDLDGKIDVSGGVLITPYFPLRNSLDRLSASFTNNRISIDSLRIMSGKSELAGSGSVSGLRRALGGRRKVSSPIYIDIDITSSGMDAEELLKAYNSGANFKPSSASDTDEEISNEEYLEQVISDTDTTAAGSTLIVVPSNINADLKVNARNITYSGLDISTLNAGIVAKDHCVQITDTYAHTNMGEIGFEGFYATRSKQDIQAGFDFNLKDITADKVIALMPAVDTIMPLLKSFNGLLNCEIAATARLDTAMNIIMPTVNGVLRIGGRDLSITGDKAMQNLTKILKFKNMDEARIEEMVVEGMVKDNTLEVFPFLLDIDRYTLALSGVQNLDMSFRYHVSMIKSPMVFRFGVDLYGDDFDNFKFKIGKAKYKNANIPAFSTEIDKVRINLSESIRNIFDKGVENAVAEHQRHDAIEERKKHIDYVEAVDMEMEALSKEEENEILKEEEAYEQPGIH